MGGGGGGLQQAYIIRDNRRHTYTHTHISQKHSPKIFGVM